MLTVLFFTILCGALGIVLFQLRISVNNGPTTDTLQMLQKEREQQERDRQERERQEKEEEQAQKEREEKKKQEDQAQQERKKKKCIEAILSRWKKETKKEKTMKDEGIYHLRMKKDRSTEEDKELAWYRSQSDQDHSVATMSMESFMFHSLYSRCLIKEYDLTLDPSMPSHPPCLGRWLSGLPSTQRINEAMRINAYAPIGTVIPWRHDIVRDNLHVDDVLVRVNVLYRWMNVNIIRYETDSLNEMISTFLKALDAKMFTTVDDKINFNKGVWMLWDPITKTLKTN
jgi:flagellar biosynthesis GTPase FlhF